MSNSSEQLMLEGDKETNNAVSLVTLMQIHKALASLRDDMRGLRRELAAQLSVQQGGIAFPGQAQPFPSQIVHQTTTVNAGQTGLIWSYRQIRPDAPAVIRYLGVKWFSNTTISFRVDGSEVELITRTIGDINNPIGLPFKLDRPYIATSSIEFYATNNDTNNHAFEIFCAGEVYPKTVTGDTNFAGGSAFNPLGL